MKWAWILKLPVDCRLAAFHQLFTQTSVVLSKCPIDEMITPQGHMTALAVSWLPGVISKLLFQRDCFFQINQFPS